MPAHGTEYTAIDPERSFSSYYEELEASAAFSPNRHKEGRNNNPYTQSRMEVAKS